MTITMERTQQYTIENGTKSNIIIAHSSELFRIGLITTLQKDFQIVGETARNQEYLVSLALQTQAIVLLEDTFPDILTTIDQLTQQLCRVFVIASSLYPTEEKLFQLLLHGAAAYEPPTITPIALLNKMRQVEAGEYLISSDILLNQPQKKSTKPIKEEKPKRETGHFPAIYLPAIEVQDLNLTPAEVNVLKAMITFTSLDSPSSPSNKDLGRILNIEGRTVRCHLTAINKKFGIFGTADRTRLLITALQHNIISL